MIVTTNVGKATLESYIPISVIRCIPCLVSADMRHKAFRGLSCASLLFATKSKAIKPILDRIGFPAVRAGDFFLWFFEVIRVIEPSATTKRIGIDPRAKFVTLVSTSLLQSLHHLPADKSLKKGPGAWTRSKLFRVPGVETYACCWLVKVSSCAELEPNLQFTSGNAFEAVSPLN